MNKKESFIGLALLTLLGLLITACAQSPAAGPGDEEPQTTSEEKNIFVGPVLVDCEGEGPQKCMLVRDDPQAEYTLFYDQIEGFDYQEGYEYELKVQVDQVADPPPGASALKWTLISIENQQEVALPPEGEVKTVYVGPELVDCVGVGPQKCMQVKSAPGDEYSMFYDTIEGFDFEPGYEYELLVREEQVENPPADASSLRWVLVSQLSKEPVSGSTSAQLEGPEWSLQLYLNAEGELVEPLPGTYTSAIFMDGQVNGNAGCNSYFGGFEADGSSLSISSLASTEMFCGNPPGVMDQESAFLKAMGSAASYQVDESQLTILDESGDPVLVFDKAEPLTIPGSLWDVLAYNNGKQAVVTVMLGTQITAYFGEDGRLTGTAGCNNYSATYEIDGDQISIGPAIATRMACGEPEGIMDQEMAYLAALEQASTLQFVDQQRLILMDTDGSRLVDFKEARTFVLTETTWYLEEYSDGSGANLPVLEGSEITAQFTEDGLVSGSAGCNSYSGSYQVDGEGLSVELGPSTLMFCDQPEGMMDQETAYLGALDSVVSYHILGTELVMQDKSGTEVLKFKASDLVGYIWMWQEFLGNDDTVTHPNMPGNYTLQFNQDGEVGLQADCNVARGIYSVKGGQLDIEISLSTLAACPEGSLSEKFIQLLNDAVAYVRQGEALYIDIMMDAGTMKFLPLE